MTADQCHLCRRNSTMDDLPVCEACYGEVAHTLDTMPGLLAALRAATPKTLARPAREHTGPARTKAGPSSPAREDVLDIHAELLVTLRTWAREAGGTFTGAAAAARYLLRELSAALNTLRGATLAHVLLHQADTALRIINPPQVVRLRTRCPDCATRGLVQYDTGGPAWCTYCQKEVTRAA